MTLYLIHLILLLKANWHWNVPGCIDVWMLVLGRKYTQGSFAVPRMSSTTPAFRTPERMMAALPYVSPPVYFLGVFLLNITTQSLGLPSKLSRNHPCWHSLNKIISHTEKHLALEPVRFRLGTTWKVLWSFERNHWACQEVVAVVYSNTPHSPSNYYEPGAA